MPFVLRFSEKQIETLTSLLDNELKHSGLASLPAVVDIYNILIAKETEDEKNEEEDQQRT
jgi:hypothetical protein